MATLRYDSAHLPEPAGEKRRPPSDSGDGVVVPWWGLEDELADGSQSVRLSVVVPAKDEAGSLPRLVVEVVKALRPVFGGDGGPGFEIVVVDDGSVDQTRLVLQELAERTSELRGVVLAANVGQSAATVAGIRLARGEWIATLDADLQNDAADLRTLWEALPGYDVALGWRVDRRDCWSKRVISRWANGVRNAVLGQSIRDTGCSVRIFRRSAALRLPVFRGVHRFFGPLLLREGCRVVQVPVSHRARVHGRSHYGIWNRSVRVIGDLVGVAWLMSRPVEYQVAEVVKGRYGGIGDDSSAAGASRGIKGRRLGGS